MNDSNMITQLVLHFLVEVKVEL